ncbi:MAG: alpha/beta hydrolase [Pseudomonadota bacterium]|nr:alpha/beta hydrolase [Pseudomonadota bacterium]
MLETCNARPSRLTKRRKGGRKKTIVLDSTRSRFSSTALTTALLAATLGLAACASPTAKVDKFAAEHNLARLILDGKGFKHVAYQKAGTDPDGDLHVYLEGDGTPWATRTRVASDPTARNPLALRLMLLDPTAALYLGRPCYYSMADVAPCGPWHWTGGRYSERVVNSMAAALRRFLQETHYERIRLIGYSGGGVLAMLIAERIPGVQTVVTIAANLDIDAWTDLHDYSRLSGSLNPASRQALPPNVRQLHLAGSRDERVPPGLIRKALRSQEVFTFREIPTADHRCCWESVWPSVLRQLE